MGNKDFSCGRLLFSLVADMTLFNVCAIAQPLSVRAHDRSAAVRQYSNSIPGCLDIHHPGRTL